MSDRKKDKQTYNEELRILRNARRNKRLIVFVGAGTSLDSGMLSWNAAISSIADRLGIEDDGNLDYMRIPQFYFNSRGNKEYVELMREIFKYHENLEVQEVHRSIIKLNTQVIITTNYDDLIEKAAKENSEFIQVFSQDKDLPYQNSEKQLLKIHGDFEHGNFVLKEDDYLHYDQNFKLMETYVKSLIATSVVLFIGYSFNDPDVKQIFTWVKDILKEDFQRAYMFNACDNYDFNEFEYYKHLGINIIYASEMEDDFNTDKASQYTNNFLVALLKEEILEDKKDKFIQRISYYESLNYVRNSDFEKLVKELNLTVRDRKLCAKDEGDKIANDLLSDIFENESHADPSISHIKSFIGKGNVKQIEVFQKKGNKYLRRSVPIEKNHPSEFKRLIEVFDFDGLKNLRDINEARLSENSPELYLEQAYISYILFEYVKAYRYLRISSQLFYKKKDYVWYFISEFDRWNVGRLAWIDRRTGTSSEELDRIKTEVAAIDIEHVFQRIPVGQGEDKEFLKDLYTFKYYYSFFQEVYKKAKDAEKEAVTNYFFYGGKPGYESLRDMIQDCYDFDFNNFIMLDRYREDVETYKLYAKTILKSACSVDLSSGEQEDEFFCNGNVRVEQLTKLDLFIILRYMSGGELKEVLRNNCYQNLSIDKEAKTYLHTIIKNIAVITILDAQYFEKYLILVGYIELDKRIVTDTLLAINSRLNDWFIRTNYSELMRFLYWTDKQGILDIKEHSSILEHIIENLISINEISHYKNYAKAMLSRTLQIFMTVNDPYESDSLIQYLHSEDYEVLSEIYPYVAAKTKKKIQEICLKWKWDGELEKFSIYETMVLNEIITPRGNVEEQLLSALEKFKSNSEKRIPGSYESVIRSMVNLYINDKIIKKDEIKKVVEDSKIDEYVWLIDVELFSYESFNPEWLKKCTKRLLEIIVSISGVRKQIVERIRKTYMDGKADREILNIYFEYFAAH